MNAPDPVGSTLDYAPAPESDADARAWIDARGPEFRLFIGGEWCSPASGEWFDTHFPATGEVLGRIAQAGAADVDAAVAAARAAQPAWAALGGHGRARYLYAIARHVQKHHRLLAVLETLDNGKPIRETRDIDVPLVVRHFYHHAGWAQLFESEFEAAGYGPHGVCGQIIPWNFPLLMLSWKIAPALAAGNTVVLKPAEFTSLTALLFAEICQDVGLPPGVVNIVTGDGRTGEAIVAHPGIDKLAFTGSTDVGRVIRRATAGTSKALTLELGGKSPFVVFADADIDSAVEGVVDAIWFNQGQVCCAGSRLLVQERIAADVYAKLRARMERLRVGSPLDKAVDIGAIIAPVQLERIRSLCAQGVSEGATCWQPSWAVPADGWFYPPTLFTDVEPASTIAQVEIFGPVLVAMTFRTPDEAVELANNTPFGLAASVWTENVNVALDAAQRIKAGTVWINGTNQFDAASGFGGYRESGFGREGGREGMWAYVRGRRGPLPPTPSPKSGGGGGSGADEADRTDAAVDPGVPRSDALPPSPSILPLPQTWGRGSGERALGRRAMRAPSAHRRATPSPPSTAPPSTTSPAAKPAPTAATAARSTPPTAAWPGMWPTATARTSATRSRRRTRARRHGGRSAGRGGRRCSTLWPRTSRPAGPSSRRGSPTSRGRPTRLPWTRSTTPCAAGSRGRRWPTSTTALSTVSRSARSCWR